MYPSNPSGLLFLIGLCFLAKISCLNDGKPTLLEIAVPKSLQEGNEVRLSCDTKDSNHPVTFEWWLNNKKLEPSGNVVIKNRDDESRLIIKSLQIEHIGTMRCVASNEIGQDSQSVNLFFNAKPKYTRNGEPGDLKVPLNQAANVVCGIAASPNPTVFWTKVDNKGSIVQKFNTNVLSLNLSKETTGTYRCTGFNTLGKLEKQIRLEAIVKPQFIVEPTDQTFRLYEEIELNCSTKGYPAPSTKWLKLDRDVVHAKFDSSLLKFNLTKEMAGTFVCVSENSAGKISKSIAISYNDYSHCLKRSMGYLADNYA